MFLAKGFLEIIFTLPIYTHLETCYDMTIICNIDHHRGMGQHKCLYPTSRNDKYDFQSSNFFTSRPIPSQDPKVLSLPDPISSRSALKLGISRSWYTSSPSILVHEVMLTPATKDGNTQGAPTTAPKTCCDTGNLCLLLPATVTQCLTGFASRGQRPDPSMELKTIFTIRRTFKAFEDPRQAWGHSVHHWRSPWLRVTGHDYWLWISVISRRADNNGCVFCEKLISGAPDSLLLPSWQFQCSHSSSLSSASRSPLSLPEH